MSKLTNALNQIWYEQDGKQFKIGFTRDFLNTLDECWHILPAQQGPVKEKSPLMSIETNDCLVSILSPVAGNFMDFDTKASNFPDKLTENDVIITLTSEKVTAKKPEAAQTLGNGHPGNPWPPETAEWHTFERLIGRPRARAEVRTVTANPLAEMAWQTAINPFARVRVDPDQDGPAPTEPVVRTGIGARLAAQAQALQAEEVQRQADDRRGIAAAPRWVDVPEPAPAAPNRGPNRPRPTGRF